jgi:DNA (cytosine-5)-methyltransferase 1
VDIEPQPNYAGDEFIQADALEMPLDGFDAIHASPPCQFYSYMSNCRPDLAASYPDLIGPTRERLAVAGVPYVIENVPGAAKWLRNPQLLCGQMFGLDLYRHRLFEASFTPALALHPPHHIPGSPAGHWKPGTIISIAGNCAPMTEARRAMGIDWTTRAELVEAIPPAYTRWLGEQILEHLEAAA